MTKKQVVADDTMERRTKRFRVSFFTLKLSSPVPQTERSLELKLATKVSKRSKRDLRSLWDTLAPGSTVIRTSPTTTVIKEPGVPAVKVRNSDIAKFGTKAERNNDLWKYAQKHPLPYDKTTESHHIRTTFEKIALHSKELRKKYRGDIKIRHRQADNTSGVSLSNRNISKAMSSRKPTKP